MASESAKRLSSTADTDLDPRVQAAQSKYDALQQSYAQMLGRLQALEGAQAGRSNGQTAGSASRA
jgi:uncharacterized protein involved in exopolysaccharide biosynthesis